MVTIKGIRATIAKYKLQYTNSSTFTQISNIDFSILLFLSKVEKALQIGKFTPKERKEIQKCIVRLKAMRGDI